MKLNELSEKAHANAIEKGFWHVKLSNEHCLMLVISEVSELVEADRESKHANVNEMKQILKMQRDSEHGISEHWLKMWYPVHFESNIKNTIEDEFADIAIRLADLAGALGIDFDRMQPCRYFRAFDRFTFTENAYALCKGLSKDHIGIEKRIQFGLAYLESWAFQWSINLDWHFEQKMLYNKTREAMHGKKY